MIYTIIAGYFEDDASDELTNDSVFKSVLEKDALASQPTVSRFFNRMDEDTLNQFLTIGRILRNKIYNIQMPQAVILDLDSTLLDAYGRQEGRWEGILEGIRATVRTCRNFNIGEADTVRNIMNEFSLSQEEAVNYVKKYW